MNEKDMRIGTLEKALKEANSTISALEQEVALLEYQLENCEKNVRNNDKDQ